LQWLMAIDVVTALIAISLVFFFIPIPQPPASAPETARPSILGDLRTGFVYIWHWPALFLIMVMSTVLNFLISPAFSLLPIMVLRHFNGNALLLAWLNTMMGAGFVVGGLILSAWGGFKRQTYTAVLALALMAIGTLLIGMAPPGGYWMALAGIGIFGVFNTISNGSFMAIVQKVVAPEMQGRFISVLMSMSGAMTPLGLLIAGPVADRFGVQAWFLVGTAGILVMSFIMLMTPSMMRLEDHRPSPAVELPQADTPPPVIEGAS
jgi:DHA3 family macrolide efflux protein-like MFS transporter